MTEGDKVGLYRRRVYVSDPGSLFPNDVRTGSIGGHANNLAQRMRLPGLPESYVAALVVDPDAVRQVLEYPDAHVFPVRSAVDHDSPKSRGYFPQRLCVQCAQVQADDLPIIAEVGHIARRVDAGRQKLGFVRRSNGRQIRELTDLSCGQVNAEQVCSVFSVRAEEKAPTPVVPSGIREVQMMTVSPVIRELTDLRSGAVIGVVLPFGTPHAALGHVGLHLGADEL